MLPVRFNYRAMAPAPGIVLLRRDVWPDNDLMQHEQLHHKQQREMLLVGFWFWYLLEFLVRWASTGNWASAYRSISFEQEAGEWDKLPAKRPFWNWVNYL